MRLFFPPPLRIGVEDVARPLPAVVQLVQLAADGVGRGPLAHLTLQLLLEQGHRPGGGWVVEVLGRAAEQSLEPGLGVLGQKRWATRAVGISQGGWVVGKAVGSDPVVNALGGHAGHLSDVGGRAATVKLQDGQSAAVQVGVSGVCELAPQTLPLPGCQV